MPVIALTANNSELDKDQCMKAGMSDYLTKPLSEQKLEKMIKTYIHQ